MSSNNRFDVKKISLKTVEDGFREDLKQNLKLYAFVVFVFMIVITTLFAFVLSFINNSNTK